MHHTHHTTSRLLAGLVAAVTLAVAGTATAAPAVDSADRAGAEHQTPERADSRMTYDNETELQATDRAEGVRDDDYGRSANDATTPGSDVGTMQGSDFQQKANKPMSPSAAPATTPDENAGAMTGEDFKK